MGTALTLQIQEDPTPRNINFNRDLRNLAQMFVMGWFVFVTIIFWVRVITIVLGVMPFLGGHSLFGPEELPEICDSTTETCKVVKAPEMDAGYYVDLTLFIILTFGSTKVVFFFIGIRLFTNNAVNDQMNPANLNVNNVAQ